MPKWTDKASTKRFDVDLGSRIQALKLRRGITQAELTDLCQLGRGTIAMIETGRQGVTLLNLVLMCNARGVKPSPLLPKLPLPKGSR